jgi:ankyrin repeat protein
MVAIPKPASTGAAISKKKSSPRMTKKEFDEVDSLISGLQTETSHSTSSEFNKLHQREIDDLLKEKETMKAKLDAIEREKKEMQQLTTQLTTQLTSQQKQQETERRSQLNSETTQQTQIQILTREREEMKKMIQQIKTEKEEEMHRIVTQKNVEKSHESELLTREREMLRSELEHMRIQNELLAKQMRSTQLLSQQELEEVKLQRVKEVDEIEANNKKMTEEILLKQAESERKLAAERDELKLALQRMENEKSVLSEKIYSTETAAKRETAQLLKQRREYELKMQAMAAEKSKLFELVAANEMKLKSSSESAAAKLNEELSSLSKQLSRLETEKVSLEGTIKESEQNTNRVMEELRVKLEREKGDYHQCIKRMEDEKMEMATLLTKTEKEAKEYAMEVKAQLKREQEEMEATKRSIQEEKVRLEEMLNEVTVKRNVLEQEVREEVREMKDAAMNQVRQEVNEVNKVKEELEQTLEMIRREKMEMEVKLKEAAEMAIKRERELAEQVFRERDELRRAVERMKEEMEEEKRRRDEEKRLQEAAIASVPSPQPKRLDSSSSLYNMMQEEGTQPTVTSEKSFRHNRSCKAMVPIVEVESYDLSDDPPTPELQTLCPTDEEINAVPEPQIEEAEDAPDEEPDEFIDLPLPHAAAARGDIATLESLSKIDSSLLSSYDSAGRTPLFYAVAYHHTVLTTYLMDTAPECIFQTDCHGDAPLHAAASSGSDSCVELIIHAMSERGVDGVDLRNNMGMTPSHLASTAEVLARLHAAGANLSLTDNNNRTALFVAAAMNRKDCVQYMLDCFDGLGEDGEENILYLADSRGDTPLHAAACNGAEESLLLLLQCGISPLMLNNKGLKAIDLAQKNKKKKCREILAQYHLHFATTSDFDSVLFIAALEGQKKVQDAMMSALAASSPEDFEGYNIIKNCHIENLQEEEVSHCSSLSLSLSCLTSSSLLP